MAEVKYMPLTPSQAGLLVWADSSAPLGIFNLGVRADLEGKINEDVFIKALKTAIDRLPYCKLRLHDLPDGTTMQYISEEAPRDVDTVDDFSRYSQRKIKKILSERVRVPFDNKLKDTQLYRMKLIRMPDGKYSFFMCVHHSIMDLYAVIYTVTYIDKVYTALLNNTELPVESPSPEHIIETGLEFLKTEKYQNTIKWWQDQFTPEPRFTSFNGIGSKEFIKGKNYGKNRNAMQMRAKKLVYNIPAELVNKINAAAAEKHVSPQMYYFLALRTFLGNVSRTDDVTIYSNTCRRSTLEQKRTGLTRAAGLPIRSDISADTTFDDALQKVDIISKECYKHTDVANVDDDILQHQYQIPAGTKYYSVMLTYMPFIDYSNITTCKHAESFDSGIALAPVYMLIMPTDASGDLAAIYHCAVGYIKFRNIRKFHSFMLKFTEAGIDAPEKTVGQLWEECR